MCHWPFPSSREPPSFLLDLNDCQSGERLVATAARTRWALSGCLLRLMDGENVSRLFHSEHCF